MKRILYICLILLSKHAMGMGPKTEKHDTVTNLFDEIIKAEEAIDKSKSVKLKSYKDESHEKFIKPIRSWAASKSGFAEQEYDAHQNYLDALHTGLKEHDRDTAA